MNCLTISAPTGADRQAGRTGLGAGDGPGHPGRNTIRPLAPVIHDSHACTPAADSHSGPRTEATTCARPNSVATRCDVTGVRSPLSGASGRAPTHQPAASITPTAYRCVGDNSSSSFGPCAATCWTNPDTTLQACSTSPGERTHSPSARPNTGPAGVCPVVAGDDRAPDARLRRIGVNSNGAIPHPHPHRRPNPITVRTPTDTNPTNRPGGHP